MLVLDPVPELKELLECDPPIKRPGVVAAAGLLFRDMFDPAAAMGADTLLG